MFRHLLDLISGKSRSHFMNRIRLEQEYSINALKMLLGRQSQLHKQNLWAQ